MPEVFAASFGLTIVESAVAGLVSSLITLGETRRDNAEVVQFVKQFVEDVQVLVEEVKKKLSDSKSPWAIESLKDDLNEATRNLAGLRDTGFFRSVYDARKINKELNKIPEKVITSFFTKLLITNLEVTSSLHEHLAGQGDIVKYAQEGPAFTVRTYYRVIFDQILGKLAQIQHEAVHEHIEAYAREGRASRVLIYFKVIFRQISS